MMFKKKGDLYNLTLIIITVLITIFVYNKLPEQVPIHWSASGVADNYAPKIIGAFLPPVFMVATWLGMKYLPKIDPKKDNYEKFMDSYSMVTNMIVTFMFILQIVVIVASLGQDISINKVIPVAVGFLLIILGNYLPKSKSNFFYGIKTPWTLTSEVSWRKTHRLGGKLFVLAGVVSIISALLLPENIQNYMVLTVVLIAAFVPIIASYFYAKK